MFHVPSPDLLLKLGALALCCSGTKSAGGGGGSMEGGGGITTHGLPAPAPPSPTPDSCRILASAASPCPGLTEACLAAAVAGGSGRLTSMWRLFLAGGCSSWNDLLTVSTCIGFLSCVGLALVLLSPSFPPLVFSVILKLQSL